MEIITKIVTQILAWAIIASLSFVFYNITQLDKRVTYVEYKIEDKTKEIEYLRKSIECFNREC